MTLTTPTAFDAIAQTYDHTFTYSPLGQLLRSRVWHVLVDQFVAGDTVLELACGTGEDAVWLAQHGIVVTATDGAAQMLTITQAKAQQAQVDHLITTKQLALQDVAQLVGETAVFDGVLSNFGGLNTINKWRSLAQVLAHIVRPGGKVVCVPMGPFCPWEIGWYLLHGQRQLAFRRWRKQATAVIGNQTIPIYYPSARQLRHSFAPWFRQQYLQSLGLWLPPSYLAHFVARHPRFFAHLNRWEQKTSHLFPGSGDHYILVLERRRG